MGALLSLTNPKTDIPEIVVTSLTEGDFLKLNLIKNFLNIVSVVPHSRPRVLY